MPNPVQRWRSPAVLRVKSLVLAALGVTVAAVFFPVWFAVPVVRVHWHNPVMTTLGVVLALVLGVAGVFYVLFTLWLLTGRAPDPAGNRPSAA